MTDENSKPARVEKIERRGVVLHLDKDAREKIATGLGLDSIQAIPDSIEVVGVGPIRGKPSAAHPGVWALILS